MCLCIGCELMKARFHFSFLIYIYIYAPLQGLHAGGLPDPSPRLARRPGTLLGALEAYIALAPKDARVEEGVVPGHVEISQNLR